MDSINVSQIEQTPFTFRGDEQALRAVVDRVVYTLPGSRITSRTLPGHLAADDLSPGDAAWVERYTETVRGVEVRRLRAIWIGAGRLDGPSFSYRCAYIDRAADDDAARIELWQRGIRQRDDESESMRLHIKLSPVQAAATTTGRIEAPSLLRFAVDAILQAIEEAGREAPTVTPTGDAPSESVDQDTPSASEDAGEPPAWVNEQWYRSLTIEYRRRYNFLRPFKDRWEAGAITEADIAEESGMTMDTTRGWRRSLKAMHLPDMDWKKHKEQKHKGV